MNILRLRFADRVEDIELKSFDELTIEEWEEVSRKAETGEQKADVLHRMFGIPYDYAAKANNGDAMGLLRFYEDWIKDHNRSLELMNSVREACEAHEDRRLSAIKDVWLTHRPAIQYVKAHGQMFKVPQDIGTEVNYAQWMNLQVAIDQRAVPPDPEVEGDTGRPGTNVYQFYAAVLACMLTNADHPEEWHDDGTRADEVRFSELFQARAAVMRHARIADAIEVCAWLMMQRSALNEEVAPGLPRPSGVATAQIMAGQDYFSRRWGNYAQVAEPAIHFDEIRRMHGDRGMVTNYPAGIVLRHMGYLAERTRFESNTQIAHYQQSTK